MRYVPGNAQHIGSREDQQDSFGFSRLDEPSAASHGGFVAAIADGMGGLANGREASHAAIKAFLASYSEKRPDETIPAALQRSFLEAGHAVMEAGERLGQRGDIGSTFLAAAFFNQLLYWVSAGDSALYLLRGGRLTLLNSFHIYANDLDRKVSEGSISPEEAVSHPDREALTSYLGQEPPAEIELTVRPFPLKDGDQVILATDGIFKTLAEDEMNRVADASPQRTCEQLVRRALEANKGYQDNLTVVAVGFDAEAKPFAAEEGAEAPLPVRAGHAGYARRSRYAVAALCIALLCGAIVFAVLARRRHRSRSAPHAGTVTAEPAQSVQSAPEPAEPSSPAKARPSAKSPSTANTDETAKPAPKDDLKF